MEMTPFHLAVLFKLLAHTSGPDIDDPVPSCRTFRDRSDPPHERMNA